MGTHPSVGQGIQFCLALGLQIKHLGKAIHEVLSLPET